MGSHWAGIAMYLNKMSKNNIIITQTYELMQHYDLLLKRNLKKSKGAYIWHSTYDDISGTDAQSSEQEIIQDVSHGNHVLAYVTSAYELKNTNWKKKDIKAFSNTLVKIMYNSKSNLFSDKVDGSSDPSRPSWGNNVGDGWAKLAEYNKKASNIFLKFSKNETVIKKYGQELQFKANFKK